MLYLYSTPAIAYLSLATLEWQHPPRPISANEADAIVVLSAGIVPPDSVRPKAQLDSASVARCLHAAQLYHSGPRRRVLLTGGKVRPNRKGPFLAEAMQDFMLQLGISKEDILLETRSRTTFENALYSANVLGDHQIKSVILVTDATHLHRGVLCFEAQGIKATPSGCRYRATEFEWRLASFLPNEGAAVANHDVFHEWLGLAWYWLKGRV